MTILNSRQLIIKRIFDVPIEEVWKAWTDPTEFAKWYGSPGKLVDTKIDLKVGGEWQGTTVMPNGTKYPAIAIYRKINKPSRLEFDYLNVEDRSDPNFETVTVDLHRKGKKTEMTFRQAGHLEENDYATELKVGWTGFFDIMAINLII